MYECPNCGGNLKFDIARQQLYCDFCGTQVDPYDFHKEKDAEESGPSSGEYEVTVFTCPQCGAEILSEDTTAATFCSFCGGSVILDSRVRKERRPSRIIPFTRTREDCRAAYRRLLGRAFFAPKELKDESLIEKFRGIYMPYWVYSFRKKGTVTMPGERSSRKGDYQITNNYDIEYEIDEDYDGLAYDASSTFSDSLSGAIGPFDMKEAKEFTPSFLSGFYADTNDVEKQVYLEEAEETVVRDAVRELSGDSACRKYQIRQEAIREALRPAERSIELAMLPVWFLSYRNGDRVSYAVVNGQTGKAAADLPVDGKRFLAGSFLLAVPLFILLNLFLTLKPELLLLLAILPAFICVLISNDQLTRIIAGETGEDDKGLASVRPAPGEDGKEQKTRELSRLRGPLMNVIGIALCLVFLNFLAPLLIGGLQGLLNRVSGENDVAWMTLINVIFPLVLFWQVVRAVFFKRRRNVRDRAPSKKKGPFGGGHFKEKWPVLRKPLAGIGCALVICIWNPVSDWFYYIGALICMGTALWAILDIIRQYNLLATRKLPQLNRRGGDEDGSDV